MSRAQWKTSLGGDESYDGKVLGMVEIFGATIGTPSYEIYRKDSPMPSSNLPLLRLEPILRQFAESRNPGNIHFNHPVTDFVETDEGVLVTVTEPGGAVLHYLADYVVAADAGKLSAPKLGIQMEGPSGLVEFVSTHFKADLSQYWDDRTLIAHFINPEGESMVNLDSGVIVQMGPTWGRHSEEWAFHFGFPTTDPKRFDREALPGRIRQLLKLPNLEMEVINISSWVLDRVLADKYRVGNVFVAGDAAHRRPPTTGLGLNTSIEDAYNISWKLAAVVKGFAEPSLMDTYEEERRPIGLRNCDWGLFTFTNFAIPQAAVGLIPGAEEHNRQRFIKIFEDTPYGRSALHQIDRAFKTQDIEYSAHDIELGFRYESSAIVSDGTAVPEEDPAGQKYTPTTRPGHRLPHAWIEDKTRNVISTLDLIRPGETNFTLVTDERGGMWVKAAQNISMTASLKIGTAMIRSPGNQHAPVDSFDFYDYQDQWASLRGFNDGGAILIRPDNFVAWRSQSSGAQEGSEEVILRKAIGSVLGRSLL
ncbi:hypothetical protein VTL71DRAFT_8881 [Oculimacula yallundae]|uniref:FAD-binding domain-containing protein n=1 Tax=Oculimacula yallundae TaxID=86028 RepID=A0ABR4BUU4_9HELO